MFKWKLKEVMVQKGLWTGQELLDLLEEKAGIKISHTAVMQLIKKQPKAIRFQTLEALCLALDCNPWDLIEYSPPKENYIRGSNAVGQNGAIKPYAQKNKQQKNASIYPDEEF